MPSSSELATCQGMMLAAACCISTDEEEGSFEPSNIFPKDVTPPGTSCSEITMNCLPDEILVKVFSYLSADDLAWHIPKVCKRWAYVSEDSAVWKNKIYEPASFIHYLSIAECLQRIPKLEGITISNSSPMETVRNVCKFLNMYTHNLKHLSLPVEISKCFPLKNITPSKLACLVTLNLRLCESFLYCEYVELYSAQIVTCVGLCQNLQSLTLAGKIVCDAIAFEAIALGCPKLTVLDVGALTMTYGSLKCLLKREADTITSLGVSWNYGDNEKTLIRIAKYCQKLEKLSIIEPEGRCHFYSAFYVSPYDVAALGRMTHLKELTLRRIRGYIQRDIVDLIVSGLFRNLEKLDFSHNIWVNDFLVTCINRYCPNLKSLHLQYCHKVTSAAFQYISRMKHLEHLNLKGCEGLRDEAIFQIAKCSKLKYLDVSKVYVFTNLSLFCCCDFLKDLEELHISLYPICNEDLKKVPSHIRLFLNRLTDS